MLYIIPPRCRKVLIGSLLLIMAAVLCIPATTLRAEPTSSEEADLAKMRESLTERLNTKERVEYDDTPGRAAHLDGLDRDAADKEAINMVRKNPQLAPQVMEMINDLNKDTRIGMGIGMNDIVDNLIEVAGAGELANLAQAFPGKAADILGQVAHEDRDGNLLQNAVRQVGPHIPEDARGEIGERLGQADAIGIDRPFEANIVLAAQMAVDMAKIDLNMLENFAGRMDFLAADVNQQALGHAMGQQFAQAINFGQLDQGQLANAMGRVVGQFQEGSLEEQGKREGKVDSAKAQHFMQAFLNQLDLSKMNAEQAANLFAAIGQQVLPHFHGADQNKMRNLLLGFLAKNLPGNPGKHLDALHAIAAGMKPTGKVNLPDGLGQMQMRGEAPPVIVIQSVPVDEQADAEQLTVNKAEQFVEDKGGVENLTDGEVVEIIELFSDYISISPDEMAQFSNPDGILIKHGANKNKVFRQVWNEAAKRGLKLAGLEIVDFYNDKGKVVPKDEFKPNESQNANQGVTTAHGINVALENRLDEAVKQKEDIENKIKEQMQNVKAELDKGNLEGAKEAQAKVKKLEKDKKDAKQRVENAQDAIERDLIAREVEALMGDDDANQQMDDEDEDLAQNNNDQMSPEERKRFFDAVLKKPFAQMNDDEFNVVMIWVGLFVRDKDKDNPFLVQLFALINREAKRRQELAKIEGQFMQKQTPEVFTSMPKPGEINPAPNRGNKKAADANHNPGGGGSIFDAANLNKALNDALANLNGQNMGGGAVMAMVMGNPTIMGMNHNQYVVTLGNVMLDNGQTLVDALINCVFPNAVPGNFPVGQQVNFTVTGTSVGPKAGGGVELKNATVTFKNPHQNLNMNAANCNVSATSAN